VLDEVELLVRRRGPEVVADDHEVLALALALGVHDGHGRLLPERRVREDHVVAVAGIALERVVHRDRAVGVLGPDAVKEQVHHAEAGGVVDDLGAAERIEAKVLLLIGVQVGVVRGDELVCSEQEAAGAAGRVADGRAGLRSHHLDDRLDQWPRREVLASARLDVLGVLLEQALVGVALHVDVERHPLLPVDQVDDQTAELRRILNAVLGLAEDDPEHPGPTAKLGEDVPVMNLELVAVAGEEALPVETLRDESRTGERRPRLLVSHLEEEQVGELLDVVAV
jgi:hypothetical protein